MSVSDIEGQIKDLYNFDIPSSAISRIPGRVGLDVTVWQNRPLDSVYCVV